MRQLYVLGIVFALAIVGGGYLKTRHLAGIAQRAEMLPAGFELPKPGFDRAAFEADPGCEDALAMQEFQQAIQLEQRGDDESARRALLAVLRREPQWARARFHLGCLRLRLGHPLAAAEDLRAAGDRGFAPESDRLEFWLAVAEIYNGRPELAAELLAQVESGPRSELARTLLTRLDEIR